MRMTCLSWNVFPIDVGATLVRASRSLRASCIRMSCARCADGVMHVDLVNDHQINYNCGLVVDAQDWRLQHLMVM